MASYKQVSYGSQGEDVLELQKKLNENGYNLTEDGIFGTQTQSALKKYQAANGLTVDGVAGTQTWGKIYEAKSDVPAVDTGVTEAPQITNVEQAKELLDQITGAKPGAYNSQWTEQLAQLTQQNLNRQPFTYDINGDVLLQQAQDRYLQQGKMAMMDAMGEAAALTGGYGNTYGQQVGQQTYQGYLKGVNDMIPEFHDRAKAAYDQEGAELKEKLSLATGMEAQDYERHQAEQEAWMAERDYLADRYDTERGFEYQKEQDKIAQDQWERQFAASQKTSSGGGGSKDYIYVNPQEEPKEPAIVETEMDGRTFDQHYLAIENMLNRGQTGYVVDYVNNIIDKMSDTQFARLASMLRARGINI